MQGSIKSRYGNEILDRIFCYFMRIVLHLQNSGIEEPLKSFMDIAVDKGTVMAYSLWRRLLWVSAVYRKFVGKWSFWICFPDILSESSGRDKGKVSNPRFDKVYTERSIQIGGLLNRKLLEKYFILSAFGASRRLSLI